MKRRETFSSRIGFLLMTAGGVPPFEHEKIRFPLDHPRRHHRPVVDRDL